jgi:magnesium-transporting ATPase (P-type)
MSTLLPALFLVLFVGAFLAWSMFFGWDAGLHWKCKKDWLAVLLSIFTAFIAVFLGCRYLGWFGPTFMQCAVSLLIALLLSSTRIYIVNSRQPPLPANAMSAGSSASTWALYNALSGRSGCVE